MESVSAALAEVGLASWSPPLALSARLALAGKLGDAEALASSGWGAVQELLDAQIVGRSEELKERALRRRAAQIVGRLGSRAAREAEREERAAEQERARAQATGKAAAALDGTLDDVTAKLAASLATFAQDWRRDIDVVQTGRDTESIEKDATLSRYRVDRALARLGKPLESALAQLASDPSVTPQLLRPYARATTRTWAATSHSPAVAALARSAVATLIEVLNALALKPREPARASGLVRELTAFADALGA
jgi:hypothetical protein